VKHKIVLLPALLIASSLMLSCHHVASRAEVEAIAPSAELKHAVAEVEDIRGRIDAYSDDSLGQYEQKEIKLVRGDLIALDDTRNEEEYLAVVRDLEVNWQALVAEDEYLTTMYIL